MITMTDSITVEKHINATPARIFRALTDAEELKTWFFSEAKTDPRTGGSYEMTWRSAKDASRDHSRFGKYLEVVPDRKIVFEWKGEVGCKGESRETLPDTVVTITLTPRDGGTLVTLVHAQWPDSDFGRTQRESHNGGWTFYLQNLADVIEGRADQRTTINQKV